ncbi:MAG: hypothetical protein ACLQUZ_15810 [Rhizomicrobium sp.]
MNMTQYPEGIAIVTGAAGGIGSATARQMLPTGWPLLLCDLDAVRLLSGCELHDRV